jgi:threonine dehydrogenase-like Zn-dependent dehydrogenase
VGYLVGGARRGVPTGDGPIIPQIEVCGNSTFYFPIPELHENQALIVEGVLDAAPLASHSFPLDQVRAAYDLFHAGEALKVWVEP